MNRAIIIQARRRSYRLQDKILMPLRGKPILQHIIERCRRVVGVTDVIVAAPEDSYEQPIISLAEDCGAIGARGPEQDVLKRFWLAAKHTQADMLMRVTADCPLIDPGVCTDLFDLAEKEGADYGGIGGFPHGLDCEVFTRSLLEEAQASVTSAVDREHVTLGMKKRQDIKQCVLVASHSTEGRENRWVVDYPEDYEFFDALFRALPQDPGRMKWHEVEAFVAAHRELSLINADRADDWSALTQKIYEESGQNWAANG